MTLVSALPFQEAEVKPSTPLRLEEDSVWYLTEGDLDIFLDTSDTSVSHRREHLFRLKSPALCFGLGDAARKDVPIIGVGTVDAEVGACSRYEFRRGIETDRLEGEGLVPHLQRWIRALYGAMTKTLKLPDAPDAESLSADPVPPQTAVRPSADIEWVQHVEGASHLLGDEQVLCLGEEKWIPLSSQGWLRTTEVSRFKSRTTATLVGEHRLWDGLDVFHEAAVVAIARQAAGRRDGDFERVVERSEKRRERLSRAFQSLGAVLTQETQPEPELEDGDPLLEACRAVGSAQGMEVQSPDDNPGDRGRLDSIARTSGFRTRKVALRGQWWTKDNGPLLARNEETREPIALLPDGPTSYTYYKPSSETRGTVDASLDEELYPFAQAFYRPFPDRKLSWKDVVQHAFRGQSWDLLVIVLMSATSGLISLGTPLATGYIVDSILPGAEYGRLTTMTLILLALAGVAACFQITRSFALLRVQGHAEASTQAAMWDRLLDLPLSFFRDYTAGAVARRAMGISRIQRTLGGTTITSILTGTFSLFHFGLLFYYSAELALWALGLTLLLLGVVIAANLYQLHLRREITKVGNHISGLVLQLLSGIDKLRVAGAEPTAFALWAQKFGKKRFLQYRDRRISNVLSAVLRVAPLLISLFIFGLAASEIQGRELSTGAFIAFITAMSSGLASLLGIRTAIEQIFQSIPIFENADPILKTEPEVNRASTSPGTLEGEIELQHVSFRYDTGDPLVIDDVSLKINPGEFAAIVGPSGSGKTTLLRLLLGFETPDKGAVYLDGQDLAQLDIKAVRQQIGVVLQDGELMPGDILTNIVGSSGASPDDAWQAAKVAGLAQDIKAMPMGIHTIVGSGTLSGGQVQRLMIARAVVNSPSILFFDEATSALDNQTQAQVSRRLEDLRATRVSIAHRLSTIKEADRLFVLDEGRLVESGSYDELMERDGVFADLAKRQTL